MQAVCRSCQDILCKLNVPHKTNLWQRLSGLQKQVDLYLSMVRL